MPDNIYEVYFRMQEIISVEATSEDDAIEKVRAMKESEIASSLTHHICMFYPEYFGLEFEGDEGEDDV